MSLIINDKQIEELAHELADRRGLDLEEAIKRALQESLAKSWPPSEDEKARRMARVQEILARMDALPVLDDRSADEIIGYDDYGLPR